MDGDLARFSDSLAPSAGYLSHGNAAMDKLIQTLQTNSRYNIDRQRLAGGLEKKTSLRGSPDYDVVVYLNDVTPGEEVLRYFRNFIHRKLNVKRDKIKITPHSLQFKLDGVEFDLLFAKNEVDPQSSGSLVRMQHAGALDDIRASAHPITTASHRSAALTEAAVEFVKKQTPFVHKVARLAKHWNSTITYNGYISGRSSIFELLGIDAGREEERLNHYNPSTRDAFRRFLERVTMIDSQRITYYEYYLQSDVPSSVIQQTPLLLDPSSPYNNFMTGFDGQARAPFKTYAAESLRRLKTVRNGSDLKMLFAPQPYSHNTAAAIPTDAHDLI